MIVEANAPCDQPLMQIGNRFCQSYRGGCGAKKGRAGKNGWLSIVLPQSAPAQEDPADDKKNATKRRHGTQPARLGEDEKVEGSAEQRDSGGKTPGSGARRPAYTCYGAEAERQGVVHLVAHCGFECP